MNKRGKAVNGLTPLKAPVPPMLATAIGYTGNARFVSFQRILYRTFRTPLEPLDSILVIS
jgi:hypothetical protein